jgi:hypothetical protein
MEVIDGVSVYRPVIERIRHEGMQRPLKSDLAEMRNQLGHKIRERAQTLERAQILHPHVLVQYATGEIDENVWYIDDITDGLANVEVECPVVYFVPRVEVNGGLVLLSEVVGNLMVHQQHRCARRVSELGMGDITNVLFVNGASFSLVRDAQSTARGKIESGTAYEGTLLKDGKYSLWRREKLPEIRFDKGGVYSLEYAE